jgi:hypothetical protein
VLEALESLQAAFELLAERTGHVAGSGESADAVVTDEANPVTLKEADCTPLLGGDRQMRAERWNQGGQADCAGYPRGHPSIDEAFNKHPKRRLNQILFTPPKQTTHALWVFRQIPHA